MRMFDPNCTLIETKFWFVYLVQQFRLCSTFACPENKAVKISTTHGAPFRYLYIASRLFSILYYNQYSISHVHSTRISFLFFSFIFIYCNLVCLFVFLGLPFLQPCSAILGSCTRGCGPGTTAWMRAHCNDYFFGKQRNSDNTTNINSSST